jgi:hypothetical protein
LTYLWEFIKQVGLIFAVISGVYFSVLLVRAAIADPRGFARKLCGELALFFAGVAVLWFAVMGELRGWW